MGPVQPGDLETDYGLLNILCRGLSNCGYLGLHVDMVEQLAE